MGLGTIGRAAAQALAGLGFKVAGWSRNPKEIPGIATFHGKRGLDGFLAQTEILVCLLPATPETVGILNLALFRKLKRDGAAGGAHLINAGRGRLQVDADILAALDEGALASAALDVFQEEPLPPASKLWTHPRVTVTPHNAGDISPRIFAELVMAQIDRLERGLPLDNVVDRSRGY
jgi:glyoxylate/hydroxypyruvate reductase A